jgi:PPK2 family polyphosphate:nucleotide phosphotransferase
MMDYRKEFLVEPGSRVKLSKLDAGYKGKQLSQQEALPEIQKHLDKLRKLQYLLYAEKRHAMLIVLQALDAGGKDGTLNHVMSAMNPQGTSVTGFRQPTGAELQHDFLWRVHSHAPARGTVAIFNRSHYEDVLVVRVHNLVAKEVWSARYEFINDFEKLLRRQNDTVIIKFFLHISRQEQLERFKQRLDDPARNWKISQSDYEEREYWDAYTEAYEEVFAKTSKEDAPWYIIPSDHKWFRNLAVSQIVAATMENLGMEMPKPQVDLDEIRKKYHEALEQDNHRGSESSGKKK